MPRGAPTTIATDGRRSRYSRFAVFRRLWAKIKAIWKAAKEERASPRELFWAVFLGIFAGCTPAVGFHGPLALGFATLFKKNRLWAWLGSRISNMVFLPFIAYVEVQVAHRLRTGEWAKIIVTRDAEVAIDQAKTLLLDWCLGTIPVGIVAGLLFGALAYVWQGARLAKRARAEAEKEREKEAGDKEAKEEGPPEGNANRDAVSEADDASVAAEDALGGDDVRKRTVQ